MDEVVRECEKLASISGRFRVNLDEKLKEFQSRIRALSISETPVKASKRAKHLTPIKDADEEEPDISSQAETTVPLRPMRTARIKATNLLKEPSLNAKLRRPSAAPKVIKKERISDDAKENHPPNATDEEELGAVGGAPAKRKSADDKQTEEVSADLAKKLSVEHVPMEEVKIEILSDDEGTFKMPTVPQKKVGRPRKNANSSSNASRSKLKEERASSVVPEPRPTRTTRTKSKKDKTTEEVPAIQPKAVVKVERLSMEDLIAATTSPARPQSESRKHSGTSEASSVYEDAIGTFTKPPPPSETTFVKTTTPNSTFAIPSNATFQVESPHEANGTFTVPATGQTPNAHDSIMTEDRSDEEEAALPAALKLAASEPIYKNGKPVNKPHELFNPLIQSPVKSRVQAFEKMATTPSFMSPVHRTLRPKAGDPRSSKLGSASKIPHGTLQMASSVPLLFKAATTGSASKLAHVQKKTSTLSREHSADRADDLKKKAAEEKKRKNEERQKLAQQQREQRELEKRIRAEAILKEKEERQKKHKQQMLEEQQRSQKLQQQKREELARLEQQQKRMEQQQSEAIRSKHNESLQRKAIQRQMAKNLAAQSHDFSILHTDDDTDDEGKMNKRHPTPPSWCIGAEKKKTLYTQAHINLDVIDTFFSVQARTIDLKEIFPNIDQRKLKRNSSAVWRTPPRYSQMPKY